MEKEIWKDIPGYEGLYQVSNLGRIKSIDRYVTYNNGREIFTKGKMLRLTISKGNERLQVSLSKDGKVEKTRPYIVVMLTFVGECPENMEICHINGIKTDDRLENLRYDTRSENRIDNYRQGKKGSTGKLSIDDVLQIRYRYKNENITQKELSIIYDVKIPCIGKIVRKENFKWLNDDGTINESKTQMK